MQFAIMITIIYYYYANLDEVSLYNSTITMQILHNYIFNGNNIRLSELSLQVVQL